MKSGDFSLRPSRPFTARDVSPKRLTRTRDARPLRLGRFLAAEARPTRMTKTLRLIILLAVAAFSIGGAATALACGSQSGYSYAGLGAPSRAFGVSAVVTPLNAFDVLNGHVAGWVGVGGPGEGPGGSNEWLQIGL